MIRATGAISTMPTRGADPLRGCNLCGQPGLLGVWREHDAHDQPIHGTEALVFLATDHPPCLTALEEHPRLYSRESGMPGHFPLICGDCRWRSGFDCKNPNLRKNGGAGLSIQLSGITMVVCNRKDGCQSPPREAVQCAGREVEAAWNPDLDMP